MPLILVVERDAATRAWLQDCLTDEGYRVETAGDPLVALAPYAAGDVGLLVLDWRPGDSVRPALVRVLRAASSLRTVPILVLTTSHRTTDYDDILAAGATECMTKPLDLDTLVAWVAAHMAPGPRPEA